MVTKTVYTSSLCAMPFTWHSNYERMDGVMMILMKVEICW